MLLRNPLVKPLMVLVFLAGVAFGPAGRGAPPGDFQSRLDNALAKLAKYDFGGDSSALTPMIELLSATRDKPSEQREIAVRLARMLETSVPRGAKDYACRQLAVLGTAAEVPAIDGLLGDEHLSHMARYALERIPGEAADSALCEVLPKVKGKLSIGVIHSIGNRRVAMAVGDLAKLVRGPDPAVAAAAASSLGKIGPPAYDTLVQVLGDSRLPVARQLQTRACGAPSNS